MVWCLQFDQDGSGTISSQELKIYFTNQCQTKKQNPDFYNEATFFKDCKLEEITEKFYEHKRWSGSVESYLHERIALVRLAYKHATTEQLDQLAEFDNGLNSRKSAEDQFKELFEMVRKWDKANNKVDDCFPTLVEIMWVAAQEDTVRVSKRLLAVSLVVVLDVYPHQNFQNK